MGGPFVRFDLAGFSRSSRLPVYEVLSVNGDALGILQWFRNWRRYTFSAAASSVVLDASCLREIADKCETLTRERG